MMTPLSSLWSSLIGGDFLQLLKRWYLLVPHTPLGLYSNILVRKYHFKTLHYFFFSLSGCVVILNDKSFWKTHWNWASFAFFWCGERIGWEGYREVTVIYFNKNHIWFYKFSLGTLRKENIYWYFYLIISFYF